MDKSLLVAKAVGITGEHYQRWTKYKTEARGGEDRGIARFDLDGPIVGSDIETYMGDDPQGFVSPAMLRKFLSEHMGEDIEININSPGGSVFDANAMVSDLMRHDGAVNIVVSGACFSAAMDFLTIPNAHRLAMPNALFMIHNAWTIAAGDSVSLQKVVNRLEKINEQCAERFEESSGYTKEQLLEFMSDETWFTVQEAYEGGFVDEVYDMDDEDETEDEMKETADDDMADDDDNMLADEAILRKHEAVANMLSIIL